MASHRPVNRRVSADVRLSSAAAALAFTLELGRFAERGESKEKERTKEKKTDRWERGVWAVNGAKMCCVHVLLLFAWKQRLMSTRPQPD